MDKNTKLTTVIKIQELAKKEIMDGDIQSAKFLLIKAKELLSSLSENKESSNIAS